MKQSLIYLLLILFTSCQNDSDKIQGRWIEKDNFTNSNTLEIHDFYFKYNAGYEKGERLYHYDNDTFYVSNFNQIHKTIIKIDNDQMRLIDTESDTLMSTFEKFYLKDIVDYFNQKKKTSISLPKLNSDITNNFSCHNTVYADYTNDSLILFLNGVRHDLSDNSYLLVEQKDYEKNWRLIIDKNIKVHDIKRIKTELRKAQQKIICFAVYNQNDSLINLAFRLPPIEVPGGPPLPPQLPDSLTSNKSKNILIDITQDSITIDTKQILPNQLKENLSKLIYENDYIIVTVTFDEQLMYKHYIKHLSKIKSAFAEARNKFAIENFHVSDYMDLDHDDARKVDKRFSLKIKEHSFAKNNNLN